MAKVGGSRGSRGRPSRPGREAAGKRSKAAPKKPPGPVLDEGSPPIEGPFILGVIPGATPGKWVDTWHERLPGVEIELQPISVADQRTALLGGGLDAALVRLPIDQSGLHVIALYDEV